MQKIIGNAHEKRRRFRSFSKRNLLAAGGLVIFCVGIAEPSTAAKRSISLSLSKAITLAIKQAKSVEAAKQDSIAASEMYGKAKSNRLPTLSLSASSYYIDELQSIDLPPKSIEIGTHENYQANIQMTVPIFTGGRISSSIRMEEQNWQASKFKLEAERIAKAYECRKAYLKLMQAQAAKGVAEASLKRRGIIAEDVRNLFLHGIADSIDILDAKLAFKEAAAKLDEEKVRIKNVTSLLSQLIGYSDDTGFILTEMMREPEREEVGENVESVEKLSRPELYLLESNVRLAEANTRLEKAGLIPQLSGFVKYSAGKPNQDLFNKTWNDYFTIGITLDWNLNIGGEAFHRVGSAKAKVVSARMAKRDYEDRLLLNARITYRNLELAYKTFKISKEKYELAKDKYRLAQKKLKAGHMSFNRLLELEADLAVLEEFYKASIVDYYLAQTEYYYVIGSKKIFGGL